MKDSISKIIISHPGTDFDSLSSMWAAHLLDPEIPVVMIAGADTNVREFLALYSSEFPRIRLKEIDIGSVKKLTVVDCSSRTQLSRIEGLLDRKDVTVEIWDHHREEGPDFKVDIFHFGKVGANTTLLVNEIIRNGIEINPASATLFMLGIHEDTGSLRFPITTPEDLDAAAWLLRHSAALDVVDKFLGIRLNSAQRELLTNLSLNARVAEVRGISIHVTSATAHEFVDEIAFLARKVQETHNADVIFALVQLNDRVFIVGRSRIPTVDIGQILSVFGGGGHSQAGSCLLTGTTHPIALQRLLDSIRELVKPSIIARDIMSSPPRTVEPDAPISKAADIITRTGHSGLIVADEEKHVIGIITRREVDKAIRHDLMHAPVKGYMIRDPVTIGEETGIGEIQNTIIDHRAGFLPVIFGGKISGVVTRFDVLKALHKVPVRPDRLPGPAPIIEAEMAGKELIAKVSPEIHDIFLTASEIADNMAVPCHLVGGFVRDLALGKTKNIDIDLLIDGDGVEYAHKLADRYGAKIIENPRFRTAKIFLSEGRHVDVATAREEFYVRPGALPEVEAAGIWDDLVRRDFTINTLAIRLNSRRFGMLVDHFGGLEDLKAGLIRVLHTFSFVDDPTRILRALRFSARFDFKIEAQTHDLLKRAITEGRLDDVSPERIRGEILLALREEDIWKTLSLFCEEGVFGFLHPILTPPQCFSSGDDPIAPMLEWFGEFLPPEDIPAKELSYFAFLLSESNYDDVSKFLKHYRFDRSISSLTTGVNLLPMVRNAISDKTIKNSELAELLGQLPTPFLCVLVAMKPEDSIEREIVKRYLFELKNLKPSIDGADLIKMGYKPGQGFKIALDAVKRSKLDGEITEINQEIELVKKILDSI
ncbi:MAG: CBS domain-containing protein [bacterium]